MFISEFIYCRFIKYQIMNCNTNHYHNHVFNEYSLSTLFFQPHRKSIYYACCSICNRYIDVLKFTDTQSILYLLDQKYEGETQDQLFFRHSLYEYLMKNYVSHLIPDSIFYETTGTINRTEMKQYILNSEMEYIYNRYYKPYEGIVYYFQNPSPTEYYVLIPVKTN